MEMTASQITCVPWNNRRNNEILRKGKDAKMA
jgi:hypothetical protein